MVTEARALKAEAKKSGEKVQQVKTKEAVYPPLLFGYKPRKGGPEGTFNPMDLIAAVRSGLPGNTIKAVAELLQLPLGDVYSLLHITSRTAQRMIKSERLEVDVSDRLVQLIKLHKRCMEVFQDNEKMIRWLKTPNFALGDQTPLSLLDTTDGLELVTKSLTKIEYGVFA